MEGFFETSSHSSHVIVTPESVPSSHRLVLNCEGMQRARVFNCYCPHSLTAQLSRESAALNVHPDKHGRVT